MKAVNIKPRDRYNNTREALPNLQYASLKLLYRCAAKDNRTPGIIFNDNSTGETETPETDEC